jgi:hypothetical protein
MRYYEWRIPRASPVVIGGHKLVDGTVKSRARGRNPDRRAIYRSKRGNGRAVHHRRQGL